MGARANIRMKYEGGKEVCIYSHWGGSDLKDHLKAALAKRERWNDEMYLGRIIFCEIVKNDVEGTTGFGLAPYVGEEEYKTIEVDMKEMTVDGVSFEDYIK